MDDRQTMAEIAAAVALYGRAQYLTSEQFEEAARVATAVLRAADRA